MSGSLLQQFPNRETAWVDPKTGMMNPVSHSLLHSLWQRTGGGDAPSTSPQMQTQITANTAAISTNTAAIAAIPGIYAPLASPHLTGVPTVPTAAVGVASTQAASTAFVAAGFMAVGTQLTNSLSADVALNNTGALFTGPTVAQGTVGTWFASGTITLQDTAGAATFYVYLWDGATIIASGVTQTQVAGGLITISLSGILSSPVANIHFAVRDATSVSGAIIFNAGAVSKDSTLTAFRVA